MSRRSSVSRWPPEPAAAQPSIVSAEFEVVVGAITREADGVLSIELRRADGAALPAGEAGAHVAVHLPLDSGMLVRHYSLCGHPGDGTRYTIGVSLDRASRGGSRWVHEQLRPGQRLKIGGPHNHFVLREQAPRYALLAGGIGVTPILAMARRLAALGRRMQMLYAVRTRAAAAFLDTLQSLVPDLVLHVDDERGAPPDIAGWLARLPKDTGCYCCGPAPMLDAFERSCNEHGLVDAHVERFTAPAAPVDAAAGPDCIVSCSRSGREVIVPAGSSVLQALLDAGIDKPFSCQEGVCGTCETRVLAGDVEHRDGVLSDAERREGAVMMVCVSRPRGARLTLDV
jgi:ferredoxin-NADP reductase